MLLSLRVLRAPLLLALPAAAVSVAADSADSAGTCPSIGAGDGGCEAASGKSKKDEFWENVRDHGLKMKLRERVIQETPPGKKKAVNRTTMAVSEDVFYGRSIVQIPRHALVSTETAMPKSLRQELESFLFDRSRLAKDFNITGGDNQHLLSLAYPLIAANRDPSSVFRDWLDLLAGETLTVLELTKRQRAILKGTTVDGAYSEMARNRDLIRETASNFTFFLQEPVGKAEATWALAVIMRHARVVHPHQDVRETRHPRMYLFPFAELLKVRLHPDPGLAVSFQEEIVLEKGKREEEVVVQIARKDMPKGEEVFLWPGRLSNSEMAVRHGFAFPRNPVGIGRNITQPPNWHEHPDSKVRREYGKYDCSSLESFELRFTPLGSPSKSFVRCYRISWFLTNGWYNPGLQSRRRELDKWPPPKKYGKDDWLAWTQADQETNGIILEYCKDMRERLKDTIDAATAEDFRNSKDPLDKLVWRLRSEESKTFKACVNVAKSIV